MLLQINGEKREYPEGLTIAALVAQLGMKPDRVAVELNFEIVPRAKWDATVLKEGDELEVVHFVGGGTTGVDEAEMPAPPALSESSNKPWQCPTCGAQVGSQFCPNCGEKKFGASDLSMRHFFTHALGDFFHFDSKIFRSFRMLFTRPGFLTAEYLRGCRKLYLHPFQLFFIANLIYFFLLPYMGWSGLRTTLNIQLRMMSYSSMARHLVDQRIAAKGVSMEAFAHSFDHIVDVEARSLVVVMVLIYAVLVAVLQWHKKNYFGQHLVFSLHFTAFWLLTIFIGLYGGSTLAIAVMRHFPANVHFLGSENFLFPIALLLILVYAMQALRVVYQDSVPSALIKAIILTAAFHYVLDIYRFILFVSGLYFA